MPSKASFAIACLAALLVLDARAALALAPQRFSLSWVRDEGAEACSTGYRLGTLVTHMLGPVLATPDEAEVAIEGSVRRDVDRWRARIAITDRAGQVLGRRELESTGPSCAALDAQVLLVIAIAIDPEVALNGLSPELIDALATSSDAADELLAELRAQAAPVEPPQPAPPPPAPAKAAAEPPRAKQTTLEPRDEHDPLGIRLGPVASIGHSPSTVLGLGVGLELRPLPRWALALHGAWLASSTATIDEAGLRSASVHLGLQALSATGCGAPLLSHSWRLNACAGVVLTRRTARSEGLVHATSETRLDASPRLAGSLAYRALRPWSLTAGAALDFPLRRPRFAYRIPSSGAPRTIFEPAAVGLEMWIALGVEI